MKREKEREKEGESVRGWVGRKGESQDQGQLGLVLCLFQLNFTCTKCAPVLSVAPMKRVTGWAWENVCFIYCIYGLVCL